MDRVDAILRQWNRERPDLDVSPTHVLQRITRVYLLQSASFGEVFAHFVYSELEGDIRRNLARQYGAVPPRRAARRHARAGFHPVRRGTRGSARAAAAD